MNGESEMLLYKGLDSRNKDDKPSLTRDTARMLLRRNVKPVSLASFKPNDGRIKVSDITKARSEPDDIMDQYGWLHRFYPRAKGFVVAWLPGYSKDGRTAVLMFSIGPSSHGACGSYRLARHRNGWKVTHRFIDISH